MQLVSGVMESRTTATELLLSVTNRVSLSKQWTGCVSAAL
jgi:hypothetical protein